MPFMSILGDNLRRLRTENSPPLTQAEVAERLGILPHNYTPFETGSKIPGDEVIERLANLYQVSPEQLLEWKEADVIAKRFRPESIQQASRIVTGAGGIKGGGRAGASGVVIPPPAQPTQIQDLKDVSPDRLFEVIKDLSDEKIVEALEQRFGLSKEVMWALIKQEKERREKNK